MYSLTNVVPWPIATSHAGGYFVTEMVRRLGTVTLQELLDASYKKKR